MTKLKFTFTHELQQDLDAGTHGNILLSIKQRLHLNLPEDMAPCKDITEQDVLNVIGAAISLHLENKRNERFGTTDNDRKNRFNATMENFLQLSTRTKS